MPADSLRPVLNQLSHTEGPPCPGKVQDHPVRINKVILCRHGQGQCDLSSPSVKVCFGNSRLCVSSRTQINGIKCFFEMPGQGLRSWHTRQKVLKNMNSQLSTHLKSQAYSVCLYSNPRRQEQELRAHWPAVVELYIQGTLVSIHKAQSDKDACQPLASKGAWYTMQRHILFHFFLGEYQCVQLFQPKNIQVTFDADSYSKLPNTGMLVLQHSHAFTLTVIRKSQVAPPTSRSPDI